MRAEPVLRSAWRTCSAGGRENHTSFSAFRSLRGAVRVSGTAGPDALSAVSRPTPAGFRDLNSPGSFVLLLSPCVRASGPGVCFSCRADSPFLPAHLPRPLSLRVRAPVTLPEAACTSPFRPNPCWTRISLIHTTISVLVQSRCLINIC